MIKKHLTIIMALCCLFASAEATAQDLSPTRRLRRVYLALTQKEPDVSRYEALLAAQDPNTFIEQEVDTLMKGDDFRAQLFDWGRQYIPFPLVNSSRVWTTGQSITASKCKEDTLHKGALAIIGSNADEQSICDDANAATDTASPWWAPQTTVNLVGVAANQDTTFDGKDCGVVRLSQYWVMPPIKGCGCGPNLNYCSRGDIGLPFDGSYPKSYKDNEVYHPMSQRRAVMDEPANLFVHIITQDRPFSDLVLANYTVVNRGLHHLYVRMGRMSGVHTDKDADRWFDMYTNNTEQHEMLISQMNPHLLDDANYTFDPRTETVLDGIPASGVLTMIGPNHAWPRPRVRAARWLEALACDEFSPPERPIEFPAYQRDPATEGVCLHCHTRLDPAAMSFKRIFKYGGGIAGVGNWRLEKLISYDADRVRLTNTLLPNTVLTPLTEMEIEADINARLIDFLPADQKLLGQQGDGTIGPRGFAKILISSGAFDQCAVRRAYTRFGGRQLDLGKDTAELDQAIKTFVDSNRNMGQLIKTLVLQRTKGW